MLVGAVCQVLRDGLDEDLVIDLIEDVTIDPAVHQVALALEVCGLPAVIRDEPLDVFRDDVDFEVHRCPG
jgi:hypothetical protein